MGLKETFRSVQEIIDGGVVHRPEKSPAFKLTDDFDDGKIQIGDIVELETIYIPADKDGHGRRLVYLGPSQTVANKGRLHFFTEEIPNEEQTLMREGFITSWKKVGHRSGHWDELLKESFGDKLPSKPLL